MTSHYSSNPYISSNAWVWRAIDIHTVQYIPPSLLYQAISLWGARTFLPHWRQSTRIASLSSLLFYIIYRWGRILRRNWDNSLKIFPPCYCIFTSTYGFYSLPGKPQVWELSRLCPETSTKLCVHEFGFCSHPHDVNSENWERILIESIIDAEKVPFHLKSRLLSWKVYMNTKKTMFLVSLKLVLTHPRSANKATMAITLLSVSLCRS